jgi:hypothetical protein
METVGAASGISRNTDAPGRTNDEASITNNDSDCVWLGHVRITET